MNVFVLCAGRCGSMTFARACQHMTNYTIGHESRLGLLGDARFDYPDNHVEVDNRLAWHLGGLAAHYPYDVFYVHLLRDEKATAHSFLGRWGSGSIIDAYAHNILQDAWRPHGEQPLDVCRDYVHTVNANITEFLHERHWRHMTISLEDFALDFRLFWCRVGAQGDLERALSELAIHYNASAPAVNIEEMTSGLR